MFQIMFFSHKMVCVGSSLFFGIPKCNISCDKGSTFSLPIFHSANIPSHSFVSPISISARQDNPRKELDSEVRNPRTRNFAATWLPKACRWYPSEGTISRNLLHLTNRQGIEFGAIANRPRCVQELLSSLHPAFRFAFEEFPYPMRHFLQNPDSGLENPHKSF